MGSFGVSDPRLSLKTTRERKMKRRITYIKLTVAIPDKAPDPIASVLCLETKSATP
jgi:hypothetical protein